MIVEKTARNTSGYTMLLLSLVGLAASIYLFLQVPASGGVALLGGIVVRVGDRVIDGSVRRRLKVLRRQMLGG